MISFDQEDARHFRTNRTLVHLPTTNDASDQIAYCLFCFIKRT